MKYVKMLVVVAAALMAFAGTASATTVTSPEKTIYTGTVKASSQGHMIIHNAFTTAECGGFVEFKVDSHGTGVTASGNIAFLGFSSCTQTTVNVLKKGSLEIHHLSGSGGTVTWSGQEIEVYTHSFNGSCIYSANGTSVGTLTGGSPANFDINGTLPRTGGTLGVFCGSTGSITGALKTTSPDPVIIDP